MKILKAYKTELDPNNKQRGFFRRCAGASRFVFNWGLAEWEAWFFELGVRPVSQERLKKYFNCMIKDEECPWIRELPYSLEEAAFINLGRAFENFYRQRKDGTVTKRITQLKKNGDWAKRVAKFLAKGKSGIQIEPGYPRFKRRGDSVSFQLKEFVIHNDRVEIGRRKDIGEIGMVRLKERGYLPVSGNGTQFGTYATISERAGRWYISILTKEEVSDPINKNILSIGVDFGLKSLAVCSDGTIYENPKPLRNAQRKLKRLQRELARRNGKPGTKKSANWCKTKAKLAKQHARIANIRKHILHQISHDLVINKHPGIIVIEDLNVAGMLKNHHLAQAIVDVGFAELRRQIEYKAAEHGVRVMIADRWFPSSRLCHYCGAINDELTLADREWRCDCDAVLDRDLNAALNLAALGEVWMKAETQPDCLGS